MKHTRIFFSLLSLLLFAAADEAFAQQMTLSLLMNPNPSPYLSDWSSHRETLQLSINSAAVNPPKVVVSAQVLRDGQVVARTKQGSMPILNLHQGQNTFSAGELFPLNAVEFLGSIDAASQRLGRIPAGQYTFCVKLLDARSGAAAADAGCRNFSIADVEPPIPLSPGNAVTKKTSTQTKGNPTVVTSSNILFRWIAANPVNTPVKYRLRLYEIVPKQNPNNVIRASLPIMEYSAMGTETNVTLPKIGKPKSYFAWTVQSLDMSGRSVGKNDGTSIPFVFEIGKTKGGEVYDETNDSTGVTYTPPTRDSALDGPMKPKLCGHTVRDFDHRTLGDWILWSSETRKIEHKGTGVTEVWVDVVWRRNIYVFYWVSKCTLVKGHGGLHKYGPASLEEEIEKTVDEKATYKEGEPITPPKDHWTDKLPLK